MVDDKDHVWYIRVKFHSEKKWGILSNSSTHFALFNQSLFWDKLIKTNVLMQTSSVMSNALPFVILPFSNVSLSMRLIEMYELAYNLFSLVVFAQMHGSP